MSSAERYAVDTSVAVAALDAAHAAHRSCLDVVRLRRPVLAGHAAFEVFSVLTRMPGQLAVDPVDAGNLVHRVFPEVAWLAVEDSTRLRLRVAALGIIGGAVYDALVGEAARTHGLVLLSRDQRASRTYDLLGVHWEPVGP